MVVKGWGEWGHCTVNFNLSDEGYFVFHNREYTTFVLSPKIPLPTSKFVNGKKLNIFFFGEGCERVFSFLLEIVLPK